MRTSDEQRKHKRFVPEGSAFVVFRPDFRMIGPIIDISRGGLGYTADEGNPADESYLVDILLSGDSFYLSKISCSTVYDDRENGAYKSFMPDLANRRCGMKKFLVLLGCLALIFVFSGNGMAKPKVKCTTIQSGELSASDGSLIETGYDQWGYNYQARLFNGMYCDAYRDAAWCQPYKDDKLSMKWNDAWLSKQGL